MASTRRTGTPHTNQPEDTRAQRERLQAEAQRAESERQSQLTMTNFTQQANAVEGVWDPESGDLVESGVDPDQQAALQAEYQAGEDEIIEDARVHTPVSQQILERDGVGALGVPVRQLQAEQLQAEAPVEELLDPREIQAAPTPPPGVQKVQPKVVIRVREDIEPTIGRNRTFKMKKGQKYRVDADVARHLQEKRLLADY